MIRDLDTHPIYSYSTSQAVGVPAVYKIIIDCETGYSLFADVDPEITVEGRKLGDSIWVDLEVSSIDLTPWAGSQQTFEIRLTKTSLTRAEFNVRVEHE